MKISTSFFLFILLSTELDQLDWLIGLDQDLDVVKKSHLLLKIGYSQENDGFGHFAKEIGGEVVLVPLCPR